MNKETELRKLDINTLIALCNILQEHASLNTPAWKLLMSSIKNEQNCTKYTASQIQQVEKHSASCGKLGAEVLFDEWGTSGTARPTLGTLLELLVELQLYRAADYLSVNVLGEPPVLKHLDVETPEIPYATLEELCQWNNPTLAFVLGSGSFGTVYLAKLPKFDNVAVKKLHANVSQNKKQFFAELRVLSRLKHINLLELKACSYDGEHFCLIFEFMVNGSLENRLGSRNPDVCSLTWKQRVQVVKDVAAGLVYLHEMGVIHRDVKSANILLDANLTAKLSDFGLVRESGESYSDTVSSAAGTSAYMSPEAHMFGEISALGDTYSFGVVLLEILTSLPPLDETREWHDIVTHIQDKCVDDNVAPVLDLLAGDWGDSTHKYAQILYQIAQKCLSEKYDRPTMVHVYARLKIII